MYSDDPDLRLEADEYVRVRGTVLGSFEGENAFGGSITAPQVQAESVEVVGPTEALDPALKTVEVGQTQGDQGFSIALQKVEFGEETTRAYVALQNGTGAPAGFYTFNARILQGARQIDPTDDYEYSELEPQSDLSTGVQTEGVVTFGPAETDQPLEVQFEWSSENYDLSPNPIVFQVVPE